MILAAVYTDEDDFVKNKVWSPIYSSSKMISSIVVGRLVQAGEKTANTEHTTEKGVLYLSNK